MMRCRSSARIALAVPASLAARDQPGGYASTGPLGIVGACQSPGAGAGRICTNAERATLGAERVPCVEPHPATATASASAPASGAVVVVLAVAAAPGRAFVV